MLIDFSFRNFRSFRDEQAFSMSRDKRFGTKGSQCPVVAVYGANASGKSSLLEAFHALCTMVVKSYSKADVNAALDWQPFLLDSDTRVQPTEYLCTFIASNGIQYEYSFSHDGARIVEERLTFHRKREGGGASPRASLLFERDVHGVRLGPALRVDEGEFLAQVVKKRPNALALSASGVIGLEQTKPVYDFFQSVNYRDALVFVQDQPAMLQQFDQRTQDSTRLLKLASLADLGIDDIQANYSVESGKQLMFRHTGQESAYLPARDESRGTLAALSYLALALQALSRPTVTLVDEIDSSLHPALVREFVRLYTDPLTNPHDSQLIFTTHDATLMSLASGDDKLLDPDEIWLVEKDKQGASEVYPVTDMHVRRGENVARNYLNGVYGAIPLPAFHYEFARMMED